RRPAHRRFAAGVGRGLAVRGLPACPGAHARCRGPDAQACRRGLPERTPPRRLVEVEDRPAHHRRGADLRPVRPRPPQHALYRLHLRPVGWRCAGAGGQGLQRAGRRADPPARPLDPRQHARALRPGALGAGRARVRTRLRGGEPLVAPQVRDRGALPAHPALAPGQARGRSRPARHAAGAGAMKDDARRARFDAPLGAWFDTRGWTPASFQREAWRRWRRGESGLLVTPTGSGKTLAALGGPLLDALDEACKAAAKAARAKAPARSKAASKTTTPRKKPAGPRTRLLWITPLRALASDTVRALRE